MSRRYSADPIDPTPLSQPLHFPFSTRTAPNRFLKAAMSERLASWSPTDLPARGIPSPNLINVYKRWAEGGFGLILSGNIMISYKDLEAAGNPIIPPDAPFEGERFEAFREMARAGKSAGGLFVGQLSHPGRQVPDRLQPEPVSASDVQLEGNVFGMHFAKPRPATHEDIARIIGDFAHAAEFLDKAGYDGVEFHGAHGYLLAQFLAGTTNKRTDEYGGSLANRARITLDLIKEVRRRTRPDFVIGLKLNSVEFQDGGFSTEDATALCGMLEEVKLDFIELSGGTYESLAFAHKRDSTRAREAFFLDFADEIVKGLSGKTKTYITGGLKTGGAMVGALKTVDGVGFARAICQEPRLPNDILNKKVDAAIWQRFDDQDFGLTNVVAGSHIKQIGKDEEPMDGSVVENFEGFMKDMGGWGKAMAEDKEGKRYGFVDYSGSVTPYGVV